MRYIIENPNITQPKEIMKYIDIHTKKCSLCVKKRIINILHVKLMLNLDYITYHNITNEHQPCLSQAIEMRITIISSYSHMIYVYYKKNKN